MIERTVGPAPNDALPAVAGTMLGRRTVLCARRAFTFRALIVLVERQPVVNFVEPERHGSPRSRRRSHRLLRCWRCSWLGLGQRAGLNVFSLLHAARLIPAFLAIGLQLLMT